MRYSGKVLVAATACLTIASAFGPGLKAPRPDLKRSPPLFQKRQLPVDPAVGVQSIVGPSGVNITFKDPGAEGVCETTPGVKSYAGFVNIAPDVHSFFWSFESRSDPANDPISLWLNGGPGSDSMIGLFEELGPCNVTEDLITQLNPYSWNNVSNMLFLSQPIGVGFSYGLAEEGDLDPYFGIFQNASVGGVNGRYPVINATDIDTTDLAAIAAWEVIQAFYAGLPQLSANVTSKQFNLATESYGGHYGPSFFHYFQEQNKLIANGSAQGIHMEMNSLLIINGIINEYIQVPYYPEFARHNSYNIPLYNESVYNFTQYALHMPGYGCLDAMQTCFAANQSTLVGDAVCSEASTVCRDMVEGAYYAFGDRGVYDIRLSYEEGSNSPPDYFADFLNLESTQKALGVVTNYTTVSNNEIYYAFQQTGDFVYNNFLDDLVDIVDSGVRVSLIYGDADYICNWFGGEAVSLALNYTHTAEFNAAGYTPMVVDGVQYGETREYGNFSFTRIYEAGHEVPYYQPIASLQLFNRTINNFDTATGQKKVTESLSTSGNANTTHTEAFVPLPSTTASSSATGSAMPRGPMRWNWYERT